MLAAASLVLTPALLHAACCMPLMPLMLLTSCVSLCWHPCTSSGDGDGAFWKETESTASELELRTPFAINMVHSWTFSIRNSNSLGNPRLGSIPTILPYHVHALKTP